MYPEDTNGNISGPPIEVKCKIDTGAGANIIPLYVLRKVCPAMFDSSGTSTEEARCRLDHPNSIWRK